MSFYDNDKERRRSWWERGIISPEEYWRGLTIAERDQLVTDAVDDGRIDINGPEYADYYDARAAGRPARGDHSPEFLERFPWVEDDLEDI